MSVLLNDTREIVDLVVQVHYEAVQDVGNATVSDLDVQDVRPAQVRRYRDGQRDLFGRSYDNKRFHGTNNI